MPTQKAVKAVILSSGNFLVLKQVVDGKVFWDLPGGRVKEKETHAVALKREVREETGLEIEVKKRLGQWWFERIVDGEKVECETFLCYPKSTIVDISGNLGKEKISEFKWLSKKEFLQGNYPVSHDSLKELLSNF